MFWRELGTVQDIAGKENFKDQPISIISRNKKIKIKIKARGIIAKAKAGNPDEENIAHLSWENQHSLKKT